MKPVWLSHKLERTTPLYGGAQDLEIRSDRSLEAGDSCNSSLLRLPSHAGTHVDVPFHFLATGKVIDDYPPEAWIFDSPLVIDAPAEAGQLLSPNDLPSLPGRERSVDLVLLRTGFEGNRHTDLYWQRGPGLAPELAACLIDRYPDLRAVGVDFLSISSLQHREAGRAAHRAFLGRDVVIIEDMTLSELGRDGRLERVQVFPLRFEGGDGAPCTAVGWLREDDGLGTDAALTREF